MSTWILRILNEACLLCQQLSPLLKYEKINKQEVVVFNATFNNISV
jgi:hypothetical protein